MVAGQGFIQKVKQAPGEDQSWSTGCNWLQLLGHPLGLRHQVPCSEVLT